MHVVYYKIVCMQPLVSVIVPNNNHAWYLRERIDSVLAQDYQDFEIILLDDCSTDGSRDIIKSYEGHPQVSHIIMNNENSGHPFSQCSKGVEMAQGTFVWLAESDDVAEPQLLGRIVAELKKNPDSVVGFVHSRLIDQDDRRLPYGWHEEDTGRVVVYDGPQFVTEKMLTSNYIYNASMAVFRKSAYEAIDNNYQQYRYCGDWAFWMSLCQQGAVIEVCSVLNSYRQHQGQTTAKSVTTGGKWLEVGSILRWRVQQLQLSPFQKRCLRGCYTKHFKKEPVPNPEEIISHYPDVFGGSLCDIISYEIGKSLGFLRH